MLQRAAQSKTKSPFQRVQGAAFEPRLSGPYVGGSVDGMGGTVRVKGRTRGASQRECCGERVVERVTKERMGECSTGARCHRAGWEPY